MVLPVKGSGLLHVQDIDRALDEADEAAVPARIGANPAGRRFGQSAATVAELDAFAGPKNGLGQLADGAFFRMHQMQGNAFGGTWAYAWQLAQAGYQDKEGIW